jgi:hypothetical protein
MEYGVDRTDAIELTADLTRSLYGKWAFRQLVERGDAREAFSTLSVGDIVPLSFPFSPPRSPGLSSPSPETRLEGEDRYAFRWTPVRSSR